MCARTFYYTMPIRFLQHVTLVKAMTTALCQRGIRKLGGDAQRINMSVNSLSRQSSSDTGRDVVHQTFQHIQRLPNLSVIKYPRAFRYTLCRLCIDSATTTNYKCGIVSVLT